MRRRRTTLPADSTRWVTPRACRLGSRKTRATRSERRRMRRIALGRGEALMAHQADRALMPRLASVLRTGARRVVRDELQLGSRLAHGEHRRRTRAAVTSIVCGGTRQPALLMCAGGPGQPSLLSSAAAPSVKRAGCCAGRPTCGAPGSCVVVVALD